MTENAPVMLLIADLPVEAEGVAFAAQLAAAEGRRLLVVATAEPRNRALANTSVEDLDEMVLAAIGHGAECTPVLLRTFSPVRVLEQAVRTLRPAVAIVAQPIYRSGKKTARRLADRLAQQPVLVWHHAAA